jgi:hypothetical protein
MSPSQGITSRVVASSLECLVAASSLDHPSAFDRRAAGSLDRPSTFDRCVAASSLDRDVNGGF